MNREESAAVMLALSAGYPATEVTEEMVAVWHNALAIADVGVAMAAVEAWLRDSRFFPTIAEFNGAMRNVRYADRDIVRAALPPAGPSRLRCDGTGWLDRGEGLEPCPNCNSWVRECWLDGDWANQRARRPPESWMRSQSCRPAFEAEGRLIDTRDGALAALIGGLRDELVAQGRTPEHVEGRCREVALALSGSRPAGHSLAGLVGRKMPQFASRPRQQVIADRRAELIEPVAHQLPSDDVDGVEAGLGGDAGDGSWAPLPGEHAGLFDGGAGPEFADFDGGEEFVGWDVAEGEQGLPGPGE